MVEAAREIWVAVPGKTADLRATVQLDDSLHDLALIKIEGLDYEALDVASSGSVQVMDDSSSSDTRSKIFWEPGVSTSHGQVNAIPRRRCAIDAVVKGSRKLIPAIGLEGSKANPAILAPKGLTRVVRFYPGRVKKLTLQDDSRRRLLGGILTVHQNPAPGNRAIPLVTTGN